MNNKLLIQSIQKLWQLQKMQMASPEQNAIKIRRTVYELEKKASELNQPVPFLINTYAYFYTEIFKAKSFNHIHLKLQDFFNRCNFVELPTFSDSDIDLAYSIDRDWNSMNYFSSRDFPFQIRSKLLRFNINIGQNTFFRHTGSFIDFSLIARFINQHRLDFPRIHNIKEFFIHLPIVNKKPGEYRITWYFNSERTLEIYYQSAYGCGPKSQRFEQYLKLLTLDEMGILKKSEIWCASEVVKYLESVK